MRAARAEDGPAAEALAARAFAALRGIYRSKRGIPLPPEALTRLVAEVNGEVVGTVRYRMEGQRLHLVGLAVEEGWRRQGVGRALVEEAARVARKAGKRCVSLYSVRQTGNVEIFERMGFKVVRETVAQAVVSVSGKLLTEAYMEREV